MAIAPTADDDELVLEVEFDPDGSPGIYSRVCGLKDITINEVNNLDESEVPDCADESLPFYIKRAVRSQDLTISASGVWSLSSHQNMHDWFRSGSTKNVRITNAAVTAGATSGDVDVETIPMIFASRERMRTKGQVVSASVSFSQNGQPVDSAIV